MLLILVPNVVGEFKPQEHELNNGDGLVLNKDDRLCLVVGDRKTRVHIRGFVRIERKSAYQGPSP